MDGPRPAMDMILDHRDSDLVKIVLIDTSEPVLVLGKRQHSPSPKAGVLMISKAKNNIEVLHILGSTISRC